MSGQRKLRIVIAGGGTGGHVIPAIAVINELNERQVAAEYLWIGSHEGVERTEAARAGIPYSAVQVGKLRRYFDLKTVKDAGRFPVGLVQAHRALRRFRPDIVFSTGGYVSVPTVVAARFIAPVVTHEQTAIIGLANKINARFSGNFAVSYESTAESARRFHKHVTVTGNPVRTSLKAGNAADGRSAFGFDNNLPVIYVTGGSRGASAVNERLFELLEALLPITNIVHQTGPKSANDDLQRGLDHRSQFSELLQSRYAVRDFIGPEIADLYAMCDLVVGRSGAGTVAELSYLGLPSILVPLPLSGGGEQDRNASILASAGAAVVIPQSSATPERLLLEIQQLLERPDILEKMGASARLISQENAAAALANLLLQQTRS